MTSYADYYDRAIESHAIGFKLALGGTGLGKTKGVEEIIQRPEHQKRKFIYCANRKQLLDAMAHSLAPDLYRMLPRDLDVVRLTLQKQREAFYDLLEQPIFLDNLARANDQSKLKRVDFPAVRRACRTLEEFSFESFLPKLIEEQMDGEARLVLGAFRSVLLAANDKSGKAASYQKLADHPVIQSLFPYIAFNRRPGVRLLLVTLQKAFYGFFDGKQTLNLTRLQDEDSSFIIFLDEFDFLENDLVGLICRSPEISNPFYFVERFYSAMSRHKLPLETYPVSQNIRDRIRGIVKTIDTLHTEEEGLRFPEINQFTSDFPEKPPAIFRTRHTMSTRPLYLHQTNRSFDIVSRPDPARGKAYSALNLFGVVSNACENILMLFKELEKDDEIIYREMLRHCFQDTVFPEQMALISQFSRAGHLQRTQLGTLLDTGYSLFDIDDLQQRTDRAEVDVQHYGMYLTPEMILRSLAQHNLVFGLSATADIPRHVHHFNLEWLGQQVKVIPVDDEDKKIIHQLNQEKAAQRNNHISIAVLGDLDPEDPYQDELDQFLSAVATDDDFGQDTKSGHLKRRAQQFFAALLWMCRHSKDSDTHLLFLNTFKQIKLVCDRYQTQDERLFDIRKQAGNRWFDAYEITIQERQFIVVFYNAQMAQIVRQNQESQQHFDKLFWQNKPVIVVTQYLSAGNGVNLQYKPYEGKDNDQDFTHIGLLEAPYFYFSKPDPELPWDERVAALKENIWYQAKLFTGKVITEERFRQVLSTLHASSEWNNRYQNDPSTAEDALLNHMATFMQALGRIERIWKRMPDQTVLFSRDVYRRFQAFCSPEYDSRRSEREPMISNNLQQIFTQISASLPQNDRAIRQSKDATLEAKNEQCRETVQRLLIRLEGLRRGNGDQAARRQWQQLRQAALKHLFQDEVLREYKCSMESSNYRKGILHLTPHNEIIPAHLVQADTYSWRMDALYDLIEDNRVIREFFLDRGYELAFNPATRHFLLPYCYQAILAGAIGEEAITALLRHEELLLEDVPDALFEIADLKLQGWPCYIDCKNYNEHTLERFVVDPDDPSWHPKLNEAHFKESARTKLEKISSYHGGPGKLIYINLVSSQDRPLGYYDRDFHSTSFANANIIVVQGALQRQAANAYHQAFEYLLHDLKTQQKGQP